MNDGTQSQSAAYTELPRYRCHELVWALKIATIDGPFVRPGTSDGATRTVGIIHPDDAGYAPFDVDWQTLVDRKAEAGGYWVTYQDGYCSYSPAQAFEEGYTRIRERQTIAAADVGDLGDVLGLGGGA